MKTSLTTRLLTAIVAIFSMLFVQLAVAAYACPGMSSGSQTAMAASSAMAQDMPDCTAMDPEQATLCHLYAQGEPAETSLDKPPAPTVPPFVAVELLLNLAIFDVVALPARPNYPPIALVRSSSPPIAIRNCCFRL